MDAVTALLHGWLAVLAVAGATKLVDPRPALDAVGTVGPRPPDAVGRLVGLAELGAAAVALGWGGRGPAAAVLVVTAGVAVVALRLSLAPEPVPCGCIGRRDTSVGAAHVVVVAVALVVTVGAVVRGAEDLVTSLDTGAAEAVAHVSAAVGTAAMAVTGLVAGRSPATDTVTGRPR